MALYKIAIVSATLLIVAKAQSGYYWRDYTGELPNDALPAGTDHEGKTLYIGQGVHITPLPGTLRPGQKKLFYEYGNKEYPTTENVKILCTLYPNRFKWVKTSLGTLVSSLATNDKILIPGGSDGPRHLVVGRISLSEQEILIGKVLMRNGILDGIWIAKDGAGWSQSTYEVLVYDPYIATKEELTCPNVPITINIYN